MKLSAFFCSLLTFLVLCLSVNTLQAQSSQSATKIDEPLLNQEETNWIKQHPVLKVAIGLNKSPYEVDNQSKKGMTYDVLNLIAKQTGLKYQYIEASFDQQLNDLKKGTLDIIPVIYKTEKRENYMVFTQPYYKSLDYIFVRQELGVKTLAELKNHKISITSGHASIPILLRSFSQDKVIEVFDVNEAIDKLLNQESDALYDSYASVTHTLKQQGIFNIKPFARLPGSESNDVHIGVNKNNQLLFSIINKALATISEQQWQVIYERWSVSSSIDPSGLDSSISATLNLTEVQKDWLKKHPVIHVSGENSWDPYDFQNEQGEHTGLSHDLLETVAEIIGIKFEYHINDWAVALKKVRDKEFDLMPAVYSTEQRTQYLSFSDSYFQTKSYIFVKENRKSKIPDDFSGLRLAIIRDVAQIDKIKRTYPNLEMIYYNNTAEIVDAVTNDEADLFFFDSYGLEGHKEKLTGYTSISPSQSRLGDPAKSLRMAVRKEYAEFIPILNLALASIPQERKNGIYKQWGLPQKSVDSPTIFLNQTELAWLRDNPIISYAGDPLWMPYESLNQQGDYVGIVPEFLRIIEQALDIEFNIVKASSWQETQSLFNQGKVKIVSSSVNYGGFKDVLFSQAYLSGPFVIVMREETQYVSDFSEVIDKRISLLEGYESTTSLEQKYPGKKFNYVSTAEQGLEDLYSGKIDVFVCVLAQASYLIVDRGYDNLRIVGKTDYSLNLGFAVNQQHAPFVSILNKVLDGIPTTEKRSILTRWGSQEPVVRVDYVFSIQVTLISLLIVSFIIYSNSKLKAEIKRRIITEQSLIQSEHDLEIARDRAESANKAKSEFLANMSHEIRTPMNAIIGFTELLHERVKEPNLRAFVSTIKSAGNSLLMLINDILDLSKIEAGKINIKLEPVEPQKIFEEIANVFTMSVRNKGLDLVMEVDRNIPHSLLLDSARIRQVLFNLVGNAVKFTDEGYVKIRAVAENENKIHSSVDIRMEVIDSGCGIDSENMKNIFKSFEQQQGQSTQKYGGTGLGLTISRRLTELMGGQLTAKSEVGVGSIFYFVLKKVAVSSLKAADLDSSERKLSEQILFNPARILIVDDIQDNRDLLKEIFEAIGLQSEHAVDGEQAVIMSLAKEFDLVMMDIRMPKMDGYQASDEIKKAKPNLPIIALTASVIRDEYDQKRSQVFDAYLKKPVLKRELVEELKKYLKFEIKTDNQITTDSQITLDNSSDFGFDGLTPAVRLILSQQFLSVCKGLKKSNSLNQIADFSQQLLLLGEQKHERPLIQYANRLNDATDVFDISKIRYLLNYFILNIHG